MLKENEENYIAPDLPAPACLQQRRFSFPEGAVPILTIMQLGGSESHIDIEFSTRGADHERIQKFLVKI